MYLLYVDESGTPSGSADSHFVMAGVSVFERKAHWVSLQLDQIAKRFNDAEPQSIELHGAPMFSGRGAWRRVPSQMRFQAIQDALTLIDGRDVKLFVVAVNKKHMDLEDPLRYSLMHLMSRFDHFLARKYRTGDAQRGLLLFDKSPKEEPIQVLAREFKIEGHDWGRLRNMAEVPVFIDSKAARMIQLADLVAYAVYRHLESGDSSLFDLIKNKFDFEAGIQHGFHYRSEALTESL
jgi:hypothetical protein